jgi:hypothetical protein
MIQVYTNNSHKVCRPVGKLTHHCTVTDHVLGRQVKGQDISTFVHEAVEAELSAVAR